MTRSLPRRLGGSGPDGGVRAEGSAGDQLIHLHGRRVAPDGSPARAARAVAVLDGARQGPRPRPPRRRTSRPRSSSRTTATTPRRLPPDKSRDETGRPAGDVRRVLQRPRATASRPRGRCARDVPRAAVRGTPVGYLAEMAALREAECDEELGDRRAALAVYRAACRATKTLAPDEILMKLGMAAQAAGERTQARRRPSSGVYYEYPLSDLADAAAARLTDSGRSAAVHSGSSRSSRAPNDSSREACTPRRGRVRAAASRVAGRRSDARSSCAWPECDYFLRKLPCRRPTR